jgi:hypothetical protein
MVAADSAASFWGSCCPRRLIATLAGWQQLPDPAGSAAAGSVMSLSAITPVRAEPFAFLA